MNIRKDSGPLKWILIGISVLFLFVMLILPLSYVMYTAFSKGIKVFLAAVTVELSQLFKINQITKKLADIYREKQC